MSIDITDKTDATSSAERLEGLTLGQANTLGHVLDRLRPLGFDPDGQGVYAPTLHWTRPDGTGRIAFWLDGDDGYANGSLDPDGHGLWWLRRAYSPRLFQA